MEYIPILVLVFVAVMAYYMLKTPKNQNMTPGQENEQTVTPHKEVTEPGRNTLDIRGAYKKRWMFSYNEKDAYYKLKTIADELGLTVFAKVRLLDLLEPVMGTTKYKTYFYKVQAKHVDFVLCDEKLVAQYIIELDDNSHDTEERKERDQFVDEVLTEVGYKIIHTRAITDDIKTQLN